jgi:hypothetical protein
MTRLAYLTSEEFRATLQDISGEFEGSAQTIGSRRGGPPPRAPRSARTVAGRGGADHRLPGGQAGLLAAI